MSPKQPTFSRRLAQTFVSSCSCSLGSYCHLPYIYPVVSMGNSTHAGSKRNLLGPAPSDDLVKKFSNETQVTRDTPPAYLVHALDDRVVVPDNSRLLHEALRARGISSHFLELPRGGHGLDGYRGPMWDAWRAGLLAWLVDQGLLSPARVQADGAVGLR